MNNLLILNPKPTRNLNFSLLRNYIYNMYAVLFFNNKIYFQCLNKTFFTNKKS